MKCDICGDPRVTACTTDEKYCKHCFKKLFVPLSEKTQKEIIKDVNESLKNGTGEFN